MTDRKGGSATFWLVGIVLLATGGGLWIAFRPRPEPERVTVRHILISFQSTGTLATRTQAAAETLALETLARARDGEDFDKLMKALSDDSPVGGIYTMRNKGVAAGPSSGEYDRAGMVPAFGDVGFKLRVGEIGMAPYDKKTSPYGWHFIKRVK